MKSGQGRAPGWGRLSLAVGLVLVVLGLLALDRHGPGLHQVLSAVIPPSVSGPVFETALPDTTFRLPESLREISGLVFLPDGTLGAVQDEEGLLFRISPATGLVSEPVRFAGRGDYEAIALVSGRLAVMQSSGTVDLVAPPWDSARLASQRVRIDLHPLCDAEGLAQHPLSGMLWVLCKESPGRGTQADRAIYAATLTPDGSRLKADLARGLNSPRGSNGVEVRGRHFKPSDLAFLPAPPNTEVRFLVVSTGRPALYLYGDSVEPIRAWALPARTIPQPEGVAIGPDGRVYIASEGQSGRATLSVFSLPLL